MGCANIRMASADEMELTQEEYQSMAKISEKFNITVGMPYKVDPPVPQASVKPKIMDSWKIFHTHFGVNSGISPFTYILFKHNNIYSHFFTDHRKETISSAGSIVERAPPPYKCDKFVRHMDLVRLTIDYCINHGMYNDWDDIILALKRLGAFHAELKMTYDQLNMFQPGFLWALDQNQPNLDKAVADYWGHFIQFIIFQMATGLLEHHEKVRFVAQPEEVRNRASCCRLPCSGPSSCNKDALLYYLCAGPCRVRRSRSREPSLVQQRSLLRLSHFVNNS